MARLTRFWVTVPVAALVLAGCGTSSSSSAGSDASADPSGSASSTCDYASKSIGYANPTATNQGWIIINQGAQDAADKAGVTFKSVGPPKDGDAAGQVAVVEDFVSSGVDALVIAPVDSSALVPAVKSANKAGIPVIDVDSFIDGGEIASFVATDNVKAAAAQADAVGAAIGGKGKVVLINGGQGFQTGRDRRSGFLDQMKAKYPGVTVLEVSTEWNATQAQDGLSDLLAANPDVVAVANAWDGATVTNAAAIKKAGLTDKVFVVGFDGAPDAIAQMKKGEVDAIVAQQLYKMGYTAVETAVTAACGGQVEKRIDTGFEVLTPQNLDAFVAANPPVLKQFIDQAAGS